jgi:hypothetical protein
LYHYFVVTSNTEGKEIIGKIVPFILFMWLFLWGAPVLGADCYISEACFAAREANLVERVCFLHNHEIKMPPELERWQIMGGIDIELDQSHREYVKLLLEKRFVPLNVGTRVFECGYDLLALKQDKEFAKLKGINLPTTNCSGRTYEFVLVRPVNFSSCYWVALGDMECR